MENNEQNRTAQAQAAEAEEITGATDAGFGKFKDARSLFSAYNALQSEFTKKCQRLKALEGELSAEKDKAAPPSGNAETVTEEKKDRAVAAFLAKRTGGGEFLLSLGEKLGEKERVSEAEVREAYIGLLEEAHGRDKERISEENDIREAAVRDYVKAVAKAQYDAPVLTDVGEVAVVPPDRPASIEDAGKMAEKLFHQRKDL